MVRRHSALRLGIMSLGGALAVLCAWSIASRGRDIETLLLGIAGTSLAIVAAVKSIAGGIPAVVRIAAFVVAISLTGAMASPIWMPHSGYRCCGNHLHFIWDISHVH